MQTLDAIKNRFSANKFDTSHQLSEQEITALIDAAMQAPSAFNIQHTRFLVVTDPQAKQALKEIAYGQQKVADAAATFIVLGDVKGHLRMPAIAAQAVEQGLFDQATADGMVESVNNSTPAEGSHDEALRSASLAAMNLMTAATDMGLASGPMIGFDPDALKQQFNIAEQYLPAMLITVGKEAQGNWPKKPRLTADQVAVVDARPGQEHMMS